MTFEMWMILFGCVVSNAMLFLMTAFAIGAMKQQVDLLHRSVDELTTGMEASLRIHQNHNEALFAMHEAQMGMAANIGMDGPPIVVDRSNLN